MLITMTSKFARNESCPIREIGDGLVIMAPTGNVTHSLEDIGAFIWQQLDGKKPLSMVLEAIMSEYTVEQEVAEADLQSFVSELLAADIVVNVS